MKNFGYGTILHSFFFKKVIGLRPKVSTSISSLRDPRTGRWVDLMKCFRGEDMPRMTFDDEFFTWWDQKIIAVDEHPYCGMDF